MSKKPKINYKNRTVRLSDSTWILFKKLRRKSGLSWNLFIKKILRDD